MAHWPKTLRGNILAVLLIAAATPLVVIIAIALSGPSVWTGVALVALVCAALYVWRRRVDAARERAWVGAFSFGDVIASLHARERANLTAKTGSQPSR